MRRSMWLPPTPTPPRPDSFLGKQIVGLVLPVGSKQGDTQRGEACVLLPHVGCGLLPQETAHPAVHEGAG